MSSTRTTPRTTINRSSSSTLNSHHTNGSTNSFDTNDSSNTSEFDSNLQRSVLMKNLPHSDGIYKNPRFIHQISVGLLGQPVVVQTNEQERYHGILETIAFNGDVLLAAAHRIENNTNDITTLSTALIDLVDTVDSSVQSFDLQKRTIPGANIVEMIAIDIDLTGSGKCMLDEAPKVTQLEDDRFNRMEHFYGADDIDAETFEELDLGDDGKAGYDPEDMFTTNKEKFNTKTDFDEGKYTNVPLRELTAEEQAEVDKKAYEIEKGIKNEDVDEDDAGVKRPSEYNQTHSVDDGNSNPKSNQSSRMHSNNERRQDFRIDGDYNSQKRGGWRDQRPTGNTNRRGGQNNYSMNANKPNQRSDQPQYTSSRSSEQTTNNRSQQYNKPRNTNNRYQENLSPHEGRDSPLQISNDDPARPQRMNSGSFSQGQNSGPTSPSTNVPARNMYGRNSGQPIGRNSPAPYTGSSSSRNNSTNATSPPPASSSTTGNYSQQSNNKMNNKKQSRNDQQTVNEDNEQPKPQRNQQQQQQQNSSNNQSNTVPPTRPSQLHTQQVKQQQQQSQTSSANNNNIPPPLALPNQDDHSSSHETINPNQSDSNTHLINAPLYSQHTAGATTPGNTKGNSGLNPEADEFVPGHPRDSNSRPESRGASTNSMPVNSYLSQPHPQTLQLLQQQVQQTQVQQPSMIPPTHPQNSALYSPFYQAQFTGMQPFVNATPQPMNVGMMGTAMMPPQTQQSLPTNGPNAGNPNTTGMTTPNGASGPGYKPNTNAAHGGETGNTNVNNTAPKKAVVSVQRAEQSNILQQQQVAGGPPMTYSAPPPVRYYQSEYMQQPMTPQSMQLQQMPLYYPINTLNIPAAAVAAGVGPSQNIMISSAGSSGGPATQVPSSFYYTGGVYADPRYSVYQPTGPVNPSNANSNWQMARSPPHQQQQPPSDQQRGYGGGQNVVPQAPPQSGVPNTNTGGGSGGAGRSASTSGPSGQSGPGAGGPPMTPQYALNSGIQATYAYAPQQAWYPAQSQVSSPQTNMPSQVNVYGMMYDPSQQASQQPPTYVHQNPYDAAAYFQQAQQQPPSQQGLDTVPTGNYNR